MRTEPKLYLRAKNTNRSETLHLIEPKHNRTPAIRALSHLDSLPTKPQQDLRTISWNPTLNCQLII